MASFIAHQHVTPIIQIFQDLQKNHEHFVKKESCKKT